MKFRKLSIVLISCLLVSSLFFSGTVFAQDEELPDPGITPDSPFYFFDTLGKNVYGKFNDMIRDGAGGYGDIGDQSRYFDLDAWAEHHGFLDVPKPDKAERDYGLKGRKRIPKSKFNLNDGSKDERFDGAKTIPRRNTHPTVKPIKLMAYLIQLGCPPNGVVLDPFCGSGTTCIAAKQLVRKYIGIEIKPQYAELARSGINAYPVPLTWFDEVEVVDRGSP